MVKSFYYRFVYRRLMKFMHRYDWHYMPLIGPMYPDNTYQKWCKWCGLRVSYRLGYATYLVGKDAIVNIDWSKNAS